MSKEPYGGWEDGHVKDDLGDAQGFVGVEHVSLSDRWIDVRLLHNYRTKGTKA